MHENLKPQRVQLGWNKDRMGNIGPWKAPFSMGKSMTEPFSIAMFDYQRVPFGNLRWLSQVARGMMENHTIYIHCKKVFSLSNGHFLPCLMMGGQKCPWSKISRARQCLVMVLENFAWGASISDLFRSKSPWVWRRLWQSQTWTDWFTVEAATPQIRHLMLPKPKKVGQHCQIWVGWRVVNPRQIWPLRWQGVPNISLDI